MTSFTPAQPGGAAIVRIVREIELKAQHEPGGLVEKFEAIAAELSLEINRMSLGKFPGCTHWHLRSPGQGGTLEATWWPARGRLWLSVHTNREAAWQESAISRLLLEFDA